MSEHDDVTRAENERQDGSSGSTAADERRTDERYDDGVRTDDDTVIDPQEEVDERLDEIQEEQREERDGDAGADGGADGGADDAGADGGADGGADDAGADGGADDAGADGGADDLDRRDAAEATPSSGTDEDDSRDSEDQEDDPRFESEKDRKAREEAFAAEHDPEKHDVAAGEEFRQAGDWTAEDGKLTADDVAGDDDSDDEDSGESSGSESSGDDGEQGVDGRRLSSVEEIRDGGYGVGSAAPIEDGAMPLDHSVKAWEDTKTYLVQGEQGYDEVDPDVWFLDDRSAERAGFDHAG